METQHNAYYQAAESWMCKHPERTEEEIIKEQLESMPVIRIRNKCYDMRYIGGARIGIVELVDAIVDQGAYYLIDVMNVEPCIKKGLKSMCCKEMLRRAI